MTRKDYIIIAEAMIEQINDGTVKKKYIGGFIAKMAVRLKADNYNFNFDTFENYIRKGIKC